MPAAMPQPVEHPVVDFRECCRLDADSRVLVVRVPDEAGCGLPAADFFHSLHTHLPDAESERILLDFQDVRIVESAVLAELVALHRRVTGDGLQLALCGFKPVIRQTLRQTLLDSLLVVRDDVATGIVALMK